MALTIDGTNGIILPVGSLTKPSLGTAGAGMHVPVANTLAFVTNSQSRITIDSSGTVTVANNFVVSGNTTVSGTMIPIGKTLVTLDDNQTLSGKTISGSNNTISNIGNGSLANSSITINGTPISLGSSGSIFAGATITDDVSTNATRYVMLGTATSGSYTIANTSSSKLTFNPSTGTLSATTLNGAISSSQVTTALGYTPYNSTNPSGYTTNTGTVTSVSGTGTVSGLSLSGTVTTTGNLTLGGTLSVAASNFSSQTANYFLAAPNGTAGVPTFRAIVASDIPTLNQNTTGNAATATNITAYTINQSVGTGNNVQFNSIGVNTGGSGTAGEIRATNNITAYYSDKRLKNIFGEIPDALGKVERMSGIYFQNNDTAESFGYTDKSQQVGVIAQQVQTEVPEAVKLAPFDSAFTEDGEEYSISGENYLTVQYEKLVPVLLQAIKELNIKIKVLEDKK